MTTGRPFTWPAVRGIWSVSASWWMSVRWIQPLLTGMSPLDEAYKLKDEKIIDVLQNKKTNKYLKDLDDKTAGRFAFTDAIQEEDVEFAQIETLKII